MSTSLTTSKFSVIRELKTVRKFLKRIRNQQERDSINSEHNFRCLEYSPDDRTAAQIPIYVTPVAFDGRYAESLTSTECEMLAVTTNTSLRGLGFTHDGPLLGNHAIVSFQSTDERDLAVLVELRWVNLETGCSYMSGGKFVGLAEKL